MCGCMDAVYGCIDASIDQGYGYMDVWVCGCVNVWMYGCQCMDVEMTSIDRA